VFNTYSEKSIQAFINLINQIIMRLRFIREDKDVAQVKNQNQLAICYQGFEAVRLDHDFMYIQLVGCGIFQKIVSLLTQKVVGK